MGNKNNSNSIPTVTSPLAPDLRRFVERVREAIQDTKDAEITAQDVIDTGLFEFNDNGDLVGGDYSLKECPLIPPAPINFQGKGAFENIIITWAGIPYGATRCHGYTEIWRTDSFTVLSDGITKAGRFDRATLIDTVVGSVYTDPVGPGSEYWYWIRFVDYRGVPGPFHSQVGLGVSTAQDLEYILSVLSEEYGLGLEDHPFFFVPEGTTVVIGADENGLGGVELEAGVYFNTTFIGQAQIVDAQIRDLAVDKLFVADAFLDTAVIREGSITNLLIDNIIASNDYYVRDEVTNEIIAEDPDRATWFISKYGKARFRDIEIYDNEGNLVLWSGNKTNPPRIVANAFTGLGPFASLGTKIGGPILDINGDPTGQIYDVSTYIENGAITNLFIGNLLESENYSGPNSGAPAGWRLWKGDESEPSYIHVFDGIFSGQLSVISSDNDGTVEIDNETIKVSVGGQERVRIGKLT